MIQILQKKRYFVDVIGTENLVIQINAFVPFVRCSQEEFEQQIMADLATLEIKHDKFSHTSDHFEMLLEYGERMLVCHVIHSRLSILLYCD